MHGVARLCCRHKVSLQGRNGMRPGNVDGGAEDRDTALATHVELIFGLMIGLLSHSHTDIKIALHFGKVMTNTLLDWQNHGNCTLWTTFSLPDTGRTALSDLLTRPLSPSASCLPSHRLLRVPSRDFLKNMP